MSTSIGARSRRLAVALGAALIAGSFAIPAAAAVPQGIGPSAAQLAKIVPVSGPKACVARHDGVAYSTLQAAVDAAEPGEGVTVQGTCAGFTFIDKDLTIRGVQTATSGKPTLTGQRVIPIIAIGGVPALEGKGYTFGYGHSVTIRGLRIVKGASPSEGSVLVARGGVLTLTDVIVARNRSGDGGAVYGDDDNRIILRGTTEVRYNLNYDSDGAGVELRSGGLLVLRDTASVHHNRLLDNNGAGIYFSCNATVEMHDDSSVHHNRLRDDDDGAGIYFYGGCDSGTEARLHMYDRATIHSNTASDDGGGVFAYEGGEIVLNDDASIHGNAADAGGGVFMYEGWADASLTLNDRSRISGNVTTRQGGGVFSQYGDITLNDSSRISGNITVDDDAGGIRMDEGTLTLNDTSRITGNRSEEDGGGVYSTSGTVNLFGSSRITNNRALTEDGGGVYIVGSVTLTVSGTARIADNRAYLSGGGVYVGPSASMDYNDSAIVTGNTAVNGDGGGVWAEACTTITDQVVGTNNTGNTPDNFFQAPC